VNRALLRLWVAALFAAASASVFAQTDRAEIEIKATFLYKFGGFVDWPPDAFAAADSALTIGVLGADALASELERIVAGRSVQGRPLSVRRLKRNDPLAGLHVLFVGQGEGARLQEILQQALGRPLLVVTESEREQPSGSMINFVTVDDKVRFDIALAPAERGNLKISARLLAVARKVITG
jgi:hypothetical protein